jgi:uncharacterized protein with HEPN domain
VRSPARRLDAILRAIETIQEHVATYGLDNGTAFDAVRMRLVEIGEATKALDPALLAQEPEIPWSQVKRMRDHVVHRYFDTVHAYVAQTVREDLAPLAEVAAPSDRRQPCPHGPWWPLPRRQPRNRRSCPSRAREARGAPPAFAAS